MIEAFIVESGAVPATTLARRSASVAGPRRPVRRYELSNELRAYLREKYLGPAAVEAAARVADTFPAAEPHRVEFPLPAGVGNGGPARRGGMVSAALRCALVGAKLFVLAATLLVFASLALAGEARADTLEFTQGGFFTGTQADQFSFTTSGAGQLTVGLADLDAAIDHSLGGSGTPPLSPLTDLTFTLWSSNGILGSMCIGSPSACPKQTSSWMFPIAGAGTYYGKIDGIAGLSPLFPGLYLGDDNVIGDFAPVPLPASIWLVLAGVAATLWSLRRRGATPDEHAPHRSAPARFGATRLTVQS